jgi:hypothetical protein
LRRCKNGSDKLGTIEPEADSYVSCLSNNLSNRSNNSDSKQQLHASVHTQPMDSYSMATESRSRSSSDSSNSTNETSDMAIEQLQDDGQLLSEAIGLIRRMSATLDEYELPSPPTTDSFIVPVEPNTMALSSSDMEEISHTLQHQYNSSPLLQHQLQQHQQQQQVPRRFSISTLSQMTQVVSTPTQITISPFATTVNNNPFSFAATTSSTSSSSSTTSGGSQTSQVKGASVRKNIIGKKRERESQLDDEEEEEDLILRLEQMKQMYESEITELRSQNEQQKVMIQMLLQTVQTSQYGMRQLQQQQKELQDLHMRMLSRQQSLGGSPTNSNSPNSTSGSPIVPNSPQSKQIHFTHYNHHSTTQHHQQQQVALQFVNHKGDEINQWIEEYHANKNRPTKTNPKKRNKKD